MPIVLQKKKHNLSPAENQRSARRTVGWQVRTTEKVWSPPTDVYETDDTYIVRVEIAGMSESEFTVTVESEGGYLTVSGSRPDIPKRRAYRQMEIRCGAFSSMVNLPARISLEKAAAEYEDGFLVIVLPKLKPRKINIQEE